MLHLKYEYIVLEAKAVSCLGTYQVSQWYEYSGTPDWIRFSEILWKFHLLYSIHGNDIPTNFCVCHDKRAVLSCDLFIQTLDIKSNYPGIWIMTGKSPVHRVPFFCPLGDTSLSSDLVKSREATRFRVRCFRCYGIRDVELTQISRQCDDFNVQTCGFVKPYKSCLSALSNVSCFFTD